MKDPVCQNCGHTRLDHEHWLCSREIDDGTDKGTVMCGCKGWR